MSNFLRKIREEQLPLNAVYSDEKGKLENVKKKGVSPKNLEETPIKKIEDHKKDHLEVAKVEVADLPKEEKLDESSPPVHEEKKRGRKKKEESEVTLKADILSLSY